MKKTVLIYLFFCLITLEVNAQDDYVISEPINDLKNNYSNIKNPDFTNYLLTSSSFTLRKKTIRISNTDVFYSKISYGITDNTTASLSVSFVGTFIASIKQQIHLTDYLKMGFSGSVGQLLAVPTDSVVFFTGGQTMITLGNQQNNITFGLGFYYAKSSFKTINEVTELYLSNVYVSTQKQLSRRVYLVAEGMYFGNYNVLSGALGVKVTIKEHMTIGGGLMPLAWIDPSINKSDVEAGAIPIITFRMLLGKNR